MPVLDISGGLSNLFIHPACGSCQQPGSRTSLRFPGQRLPSQSQTTIAFRRHTNCIQDIEQAFELKLRQRQTEPLIRKQVT